MRTLLSLAALAALTVLSLILMALRVRWRGPFGRKSSMVLRAVYPLVLGLGGLVLGILDECRDVLSDVRDALRHHKPILTEETSNLVGLCRAGPDEALADPVK